MCGPGRLALSPGEGNDLRLAGKLISRLKSGSMLLAATYLAFVQLSSIRLWLRLNQSPS
jgi:hypothetical protein